MTPVTTRPNLDQRSFPVEVRNPKNKTGGKPGTQNFLFSNKPAMHLFHRLLKFLAFVVKNCVIIGCKTSVSDRLHRRTLQYLG